MSVENRSRQRASIGSCLERFTRGSVANVDYRLVGREKLVKSDQIEVPVDSKVGT